MTLLTPASPIASKNADTKAMAYLEVISIFRLMDIWSGTYVVCGLYNMGI